MSFERPSFDNLNRKTQQGKPAETMKCRFQDDKILSFLEQIFSALKEIKQELRGVSKSHLTVAEVSHLVGRSEYTVRRWIQEKQIEAIRIQGSGSRGKLLIPRAELDKLLLSGKGGNLPPVSLAE